MALRFTGPAFDILLRTCEFHGSCVQLIDWYREEDFRDRRSVEPIRQRAQPVRNSLLHVYTMTSVTAAAGAPVSATTVRVCVAPA